MKMMLEEKTGQIPQATIEALSTGKSAVNRLEPARLKQGPKYL
jgi:hypothetical protein